MLLMDGRLGVRCAVRGPSGNAGVGEFPMTMYLMIHARAVRDVAKGVNISTFSWVRSW